MNLLTNLVLSAITALIVGVLYAVLPPQIYFTLLGAGGAMLVMSENKGNDSTGK